MQILNIHDTYAYDRYIEEYNGADPLWEDIIDFDEDGCGFVYAKEGGGFINPQGVILIPLVYDHYAIFKENISVIRLNGKWGIITRKNETIIPFEYDHCRYPTDGKIIACKNAKYGILNHKNEILLPFRYDFISNFSEEYIAVCKDGKYGVINWEEETVLGFHWEYAEIVGDYFCTGRTSDLFYNRERYIDDAVFCSETFKCFTKDFQKIDFGIIDLHQNIVFPFISDFKISNFNSENGRAEVSKYWQADNLPEDEKHFVADMSGKKIPFTDKFPGDGNWEEIRERINLLIWEPEKSYTKRPLQ